MHGPILIVGGGFAGIATAYHLARRGVSDIVVLEREQGPGYHASGRNAGLLRQSTHDPALAPLLRTGARFARRALAKVPGGLIGAGSLILGGQAEELHPGPDARMRPAAELVEGLDGRGLHDPSDAIIDPHSLLQIYENQARARGVRFSYGEEVLGIEQDDGKVRAVQTNRARHPAKNIIVAAGAWACEVAALAGSHLFDPQIKRRHLFHASLYGRDTTRWPFIWDDQLGIYFLPEGPGLLASPCDTDPHPATEPEYDPTKKELLAERLAEHFAELGDWRIGPGWACLRTFAPDHRFVIGRDPQVSGLFWVAALGGHGVTTSWAVGRLAAQVFLGRQSAGAFDPARFARG